LPLWILFTIAAAFLQNLRSALQKHLTGTLSVSGASYVRFLYGFPAALIYLWLVLEMTGSALPSPNSAFLLYGLVGGVAQILGTVLLVGVFQFRNFAAGTAYSKTETVQAALAGIILLGDTISLGAALAILISLMGVMLLSLSHSGVTLGGALRGFMQRPALMGMASGTAFGVAAVCYRAASLSLGFDGFVLPAAFTLAYVLGAQTLIMTVWLFLREREQLRAVLVQWKWAGLTGLAGALGSIGWFSAMTLENAAYVRALGQIELIFTFAASYFIFKERSTKREVTGTLLVAGGLILLVLTA